MGIRTTVYMDKSLYRRLRIRLAAEGMTFSAWVRAMIVAWLDGEQKAGG